MALACLTPKLNPWVDVAILTTGLGLSSFTLAGTGSMSHVLFQGICSWSKKTFNEWLSWDYVLELYYLLVCWENSLLSQWYICFGSVCGTHNFKTFLCLTIRGFESGIDELGMNATFRFVLYTPGYLSEVCEYSSGEFFSYSLQFADAYSIRYLTLKGPRGLDVLGGVLSYFLTLLVKNVKIDLVYNDPIYHMYNSNQNIHICKLNHGEIWACINEHDLNTYNVYLINHSCHVWLDFHFLFK